METEDLLPIVAARTAWVLDDRFDQEQEVEKQLKVTGIKPVVGETDIDAIRAPIDGVKSGILPPPDLIIIDQHWDTRLQTLDILGHPEIIIGSPLEVGYALGRLFRSIPILNGSCLVMTSRFDGEFDEKLRKLSNVILVPKGDQFGPNLLQAIKDENITFQDRVAALAAEERDPYHTGSLKFLRALAKSYDIDEGDLPRLLGSREELPASTEDVVSGLLNVSRDARERMKLLIELTTLLRLGQPNSRTLGRSLQRESIQDLLLNGSFSEFLSLKFELENAGGGGGLTK